MARAKPGPKRKDRPRYPSGGIKKEYRDSSPETLAKIEAARQARAQREKKSSRRAIRPDDRLFEGQIVCLRQGYPVVQRNGRVMPVHLLVWEAANGPRPDGMHIHHKNHDRSDWSLENLELLTPDDHSKTHAGFTKTDGVWTHKPCVACGKQLPFKEFSPSNGGYQSRCRPCRSEYVWAREKANRARRQSTAIAQGDSA